MSIYSIETFEPKGSHTYLLDTNILIPAFAPIGFYNENLQRKITNFLTQAKGVSASIAITSLILSEFYNVIFKDYFDDWILLPENAEIQKNLNKSQILKQIYRPTDEYKNNIKSINASINQLFSITDKYNDDFSSLNTVNILTRCQDVDYNDSYIIELATKKDWIVCTRDIDIINSANSQCSVISFV